MSDLCHGVYNDHLTDYLDVFGKPREKDGYLKTHRALIGSGGANDFLMGAVSLHHSRYQEHLL